MKQKVCRSFNEIAGRQLDIAMYTLSGLNPRDGEPIEITVRDGIIHAIASSRHRDDHWISSALVDLQVNGYCGSDVNLDVPDPEAIIELTAKMIAVGVTTYLPTIITASERKIQAALRAVAIARKRSRLVSQCVPFVHVEGPHISPLEGYRGAHPVEHVRPPSLAEFARWQHAGDGLVGLVTLSPHYRESEEYIRGLTALGVHTSIGHTHATADEIARAVDAGARLSTHLGNGIAGMIPRHGNPIWSQLADDRLSAAFIADGHHLPADAIKAMVKAKGAGRSMLVSDTVALAGLPPGTYSAPIGGQVELHSNGRLSLAGTEFLAGAIVPLKDGIPRAMSMTGMSLAECIQMATENPGRFAGHSGRMRVGEPADLIQFRIESGDNRMCIDRVLLKGEEWS